MADLLRQPAIAAAPIDLPGLSLTELPPPALINLRLGADALPVAGALLGVDPPRDANRFVEAGDLVVAWIAPDEWMLVAPPATGRQLLARLEGDLAGRHVSINDVSGNRARFRLAGSRAREILGAGCSLDLHPRCFGPGSCAQTLLARAGIVLLQRDDVPSFELFPRRSFARHLWTWLDVIARTP